ncbi:uncharacterized protein LOC128889607 [Hylaeus anthracinus]|uniref:uncharacterized protein LOC128889607 n=1 Tax=Hylaeus anthracinus TaxID=313031 RepID=UPI0023BA37E8|nr:uncharacterized protein LOC128889607 [Hylaeus anthracinus]
MDSGPWPEIQKEGKCRGSHSPGRNEGGWESFDGEDPEERASSRSASSATATVTITVPKGSSATYEEAVRVTRRGIDLAALGIEALSWKTAVTGGLITKIPGAESAARADALVNQMKTVLGGMNVMVSRPVKKAEFRLTGLDISGTPQEVALAVAAIGKCFPDSANLNNCRRARDLFVQCLAEWQVGLAVAAEPYRVPEHPHWFGDEAGSVAMCGSAEFERYLDRLGGMMAPHLAGLVLVLGDLYARSTDWGNLRTGPRGGALESLLEGHGLLVLNRGSVPTCVRWNGWSIVDIMLATPAASRRVSNWRVWGGENLSDHCYILMNVAVVSEPPLDTPLRSGTRPAPRWALKRLDKDLLRLVIIGTAWPRATECGAEEGAEWIRSTLQMICDVAMPRIRDRPQKRSVYW